MVNQLQVCTTTTSTSAPVDTTECEKAIADFAECGITARLEGDTIAIIGPHVTLHLPPFDLLTTPTYAAGYACGAQQRRQSIDADISVSLTDHDFTRRIDQAIPATLSPEEHQRWRAGFLTGWVMQWYQTWRRCYEHAAALHELSAWTAYSGTLSRGSTHDCE